MSKCTHFTRRPCYPCIIPFSSSSHGWVGGLSWAGHRCTTASTIEPWCPLPMLSPAVHNASLFNICAFFGGKMGLRTLTVSMQGQLDPKSRVSREVVSVMKYKVWKTVKIWPFSKWGQGLATHQIPQLCFHPDLGLRSFWTRSSCL